MNRWIAVASVLAACGGTLNRLTAGSTAKVLLAGKPALEREADYDLARDALPTQLKLAESLLEVSPDNDILLQLCAQAFSQYAYGFVEEESEAIADADPERAKVLKARARDLYLRGMRFGLRMLARQDSRFPGVFYKSDEELRAAVASLGDGALPGLFWTGFGMAGAINVGKERPELIAWLPRIGIVMERAAAIDEKYFFASPLLTLGAFWGGRSATFGGDLPKGKQYFERALALYPDFLTIKVLYARLYAVQAQDGALYRRLLDEVLAADLSKAMPEQRLANTIAQRKARRYLAEADNLFLE